MARLPDIIDAAESGNLFCICKTSVFCYNKTIVAANSDGEGRIYTRRDDSKIYIETCRDLWLKDPIALKKENKRTYHSGCCLFFFVKVGRIFWIYDEF